MWVKLDDGYTEHLKLFEAGRHLGGRHGYARALAVDVQGMCYANRTESDGFLPEIVVKSFHDSRPLDVAEVLVMVRRWHRAPGGFQIHDFLDFQPLAADLRAKRAKDNDRKKRKKGSASGQKFRAESAWNPPTPDPDPVLTQKDHGGAPRAGCGEPVENASVLKALIWREVQAAYGDPAESWDLVSVTERCKVVAARARLIYSVEDFRGQIEVAMARVEAQQARRRA